MLDATHTPVTTDHIYSTPFQLNTPNHTIHGLESLLGLSCPFPFLKAHPPTNCHQYLKHGHC